MHRILFFLLFLPFILSCNERSSESLTVTEQEEVLKDGSKDKMLLLTDRPPNFETPLKYFLLDFTPNDVFFVRWHLAGLPAKVDPDTFRLRVNGDVKKDLSLSLNDLKTKFKPYALNALCICAGNSRSFFDPRVPGAQWKNGAMGNARWTGVKLKDVLEMAGVKANALDVSFNGMDEPPLPSVPDFVKSLRMDHAMDGEVMVAYEMNGEPLPLLNGYPLKLVVPGWYATYWVGMLSEIKVYPDSFKGYWMKKAYLIPENVSNGNERPDSLSKKMTPINRVDIRSLFVSPENGSKVHAGKTCTVRGVAFDGGNPINAVEISADSGATWKQCNLEPSLGRYSWQKWNYSLMPSSGKLFLLVRAIDSLGVTQPAHQWNRSGYMRNEIESLTLEVVN